MKKYLFASWLSMLLLFTSCVSRNVATGPGKYPRGLDIIGSIEEYQESVDNNPDNLLVDLEDFIPGVVLDIRYATTNNFTGKQVYAIPKAFLRRPVAEKLKGVQEKLSEEGLGLIVFDAYRPYADTVRFFEIMPDPDFCADPKYGSRHNRGCAVDVSLYSLNTGEPLPMPSGYDDFSEKAHPDYTGATLEERANRDKLIAAMEEHGFSVYPTEWWHFDFEGWESYKLMDLSFEQLLAQ